MTEKPHHTLEVLAAKIEKLEKDNACLRQEHIELEARVFDLLTAFKKEQDNVTWHLGDITKNLGDITKNLHDVTSHIDTIYSHLGDAFEYLYPIINKVLPGVSIEMKKIYGILKQGDQASPPVTKN